MAAAVKSDLDDEEYDQVSEFDMSEPESDADGDQKEDTPPSTPSTPHHKRPSDTKKLTCHYDGCAKTFNRQARLDEHLRSHTNTRLFKCPHCPKDFLRDSHLKHHVKSAHSNIRDYTCSYEGCDKSFATGTRLRRHEATHSGQNKYTCTGYEGCSQTFRKKETLSRHVLQAHEDTSPFPCVEVDSNTGEACRKIFNTAGKLKAHQRAMHDSTRFSCNVCTQEQAMAYRDSSKAKEEISGAYFATFAALKRHMDAEHPQRCNICSLPFKTLKELTRHGQLVHNFTGPDVLPKEELHNCPHAGCDRGFSKKGNLTVHIKTVHEKRRDFVCGQTEVSLPEIASDTELAGCGRDFTSKRTLEEHIRTAHLGMQAKRVEQNQKRRAEKQEADDEDEAVPKKRRTRKDKGVQKTSAIQSLVGGFPVYRRGSIAQADMYNSDEDEESDAYSAYDDDEDDDDDTGLTGSMVMHGSHIFHGDSAFHFESGSSSFSTQPPAEQLYQPVAQTSHPFAHEPLPDLNFDPLDLRSPDGILAGNPIFANLSTAAQEALHGSDNFAAQKPTPFDLPGDEWFHLQQQQAGDEQAATGVEALDPRLWNLCELAGQYAEPTRNAAT